MVAMAACRNCGATIVNEPCLRGRPRTTYCSTACKEAWHLEQDRRERAARREGRSCRMCGAPILAPTLKAKTCSRMCGNDYQNWKKQQAKLARWKREKPACGYCGGVIGPDRRRGTKYWLGPLASGTPCRLGGGSAPRSTCGGYLYGITPEEFTALLEAQGGRCAICGTETPGGKGGWHLDHDHDTGAIRGLLCHACNIALGYMGDDQDRLEAAIEYLRAHRA